MKFIDLPYDTRYHILSFLKPDDVLHYLETSNVVCDECVAHDYPFYFKVGTDRLKRLPENVRSLFVNISSFGPDVLPGIDIKRLIKVQSYGIRDDYLNEMISLQKLACALVGEVKLPLSIKKLYTKGDDLVITNAKELTSLSYAFFYASVPPCIRDLPSLATLRCAVYSEGLGNIASTSVTNLNITIRRPESYKWIEGSCAVSLLNLPNLISVDIVSESKWFPKIYMDTVSRKVKKIMARCIIIDGFFPQDMDVVSLVDCVLETLQEIDSKKIISSTIVRFTNRAEVIDAENLGHDLTEYTNLREIATTGVYPKTFACKKIDLAFTKDTPMHISIENHTEIVSISCRSAFYTSVSISFTESLVSLKLFGLTMKIESFPDSIKTLRIWDCKVQETLDFNGTKLKNLRIREASGLYLIKNLPNTIEELEVTTGGFGSVEIENIPTSLKKLDVSMSVIFPDLPDDVVRCYHN